MNNSRNGLESPVLPQGIVGPMMPLAFESSGVSSSPIDIQQPRVPTSTLASALASATLENQRVVCVYYLFFLH